MENTEQKQFTTQRIFEILHQIPLDIEGSNISNTGWYPNPEWDAEFMDKAELDRLTAEAIEKDSKVLFKNVFLEYDSCDCNDGMCSHGSWVYQLRVLQNGAGVPIEIEDEEQFYAYLDGKTVNIPIKESTVYDFYRMCEIVGIQLEFSEYAKSILKSE